MSFHGSFHYLSYLVIHLISDKLVEKKTRSAERTLIRKRRFRAGYLLFSAIPQQQNQNDDNKTESAQVAHFMACVQIHHAGAQPHILREWVLNLIESQTVSENFQIAGIAMIVLGSLVIQTVTLLQNFYVVETKAAAAVLVAAACAVIVTSALGFWGAYKKVLRAMKVVGTLALLSRVNRKIYCDCGDLVNINGTLMCKLLKIQSRR